MTNTKRTNKILSWILCLAMVLTILPMSVFAAETVEVTGETDITMQRGVSFFGTGINGGFYVVTPPDGVDFTNIDWSVSGDLPEGITLGVNRAGGDGSARAYIGGTPTAMTNGAVSVTINAEATDGTNTYTGSLAVSITVEDSPAHMLLDELIQGAVCEVPMTTANTAEAVVAWVQTTWLPSLDGYSELVAQLGNGYSITVEDASTPDEGIGAFTAAVAGTEADPDGTDGSLTVRFRLDENYNYLDNSKECIIKATKYEGSPDTDTHTVTFYPNGGTGLMKQQIFTAGVQQSLTPNAFARTGYIFMGWNTQENGEGTPYSDNASITLTDNLILYAQWKELTITADQTTLTGNGTITFTTSFAVGGITCSESKYERYISGRHSAWTFQMKNNVTTDLTFTITYMGETASCTVSFEQDTNALILTPSRTSLFGNGVITLTGNKDIASISCSNQFYEDYISGSGQNWQFVMDRNVDVNLYFEATAATGETALCWISFKAATYENENVIFQPIAGVTLPDDAELVVKEHTATIEPVAAIVGSDDEIEYITVADSDIYVSEPPVVLNGVTYYMDEIIMIDGEEFLVMDTDSHMLNLIRLSDSVQLDFDGKRLIKTELPALKAEKRENQKVNINGVIYDVVAVRDGFSSLDIYSLYYKGIPAGKYRSEAGTAVFQVGFDPATLKAQRDDIYLGRVTADNTAIADLTPGKTYNAYVVGANDIHLEGAENVGGTVAQTFEVPAQFVGNIHVKYIAYHGLVEGYELGKTLLSEDGKTLIATYEVSSFSPFIVYAFVEADEPEIKEITTTTSKPSSSGGGVSRYTIKFDTDGGTQIANKTVTRNSKLAEPEAPTKDGYTFNGWYTDEELTEKYDFDKAVTKGFTLYAKWDKHDDEQTSAFENPFTDVDTSDWFYEDVKYAVENGLFNGTTDTTFAPNGIITRAMMVTVLYRAEGEPEMKNAQWFEDVAKEQWYSDAVAWATFNGITMGYGDGNFGPDDYITREQIAAIMHRYAQYKGIDVSVGENTNILSYDDFADISEYAIVSMQYAVGSGILRGKTESTLNPLDNATRAEIAAILHRFIEANK